MTQKNTLYHNWIFNFNIFHLTLCIKGQSMQEKKRKEENAIAAKHEINLIV